MSPGATHVTVHRLRFCDTDKLGHVNNAVFAVMLEQGRSELAAELGMPLNDPALSLVIARLELDFVAEMTWPGDVTIETAVLRLGGKSFTFRQTLTCNGILAGRARTVLVVMDRQTRRAVPIDPWRDKLAPLLQPDEA